MDNELQLKNITISKVESLTWGLKIADEKGLIYNIPYEKKAGGQTVASKTISELPNNGLGLKKCFKFAVVDNKQGGQSRYVRVVGEPEDSPQQLGTKAYVNERYNQSNSPITPPQANTGRDFKAEAFGKCKHAFLVELLKINAIIEDRLSKNEMEKQAEEFAEMSMRKLPVNIPGKGKDDYPPYNETNPTQFDREVDEKLNGIADKQDDMPVENIPF